MVKAKFTHKLRKSIAIIGYRYRDGLGQEHSYVSNIGFVLEGKYIISSYCSILGTDDISTTTQGKLFADILGTEIPIRYIDGDRRRNLLVFEIPHPQNKLGISIKNIAWNGPVESDDEWIEDDEWDEQHNNLD